MLERKNGEIAGINKLVLRVKVVKNEGVNFFKRYQLFLCALSCVFAQQLGAAAGDSATSSSQDTKDSKTVDFALLKKREALEAEQARLKLEAERKKRLEQLQEAESRQSENLSEKLKNQQAQADTKYKNQYFANLKGARPVLTADLPVEYDTESGILLARKNAKLTDKQFQLSADVIGFSSADSAAAASGDVRFSQEKLRFLSENLSIGIKDSAFKSDYSRFGSNPIFIETEALDYNNKNFTAKDSTVYFGEPDTFALNMEVSDIAYDSNTDLLELNNVLFKFGPAPFFYVPYYAQYGLDRPPFEVENRVGYNGDYGLLLQNTILYTGLGNVSPGVLLDYYSKRGFLLGPAADYDYKSEDFAISGEFRSGYINDNGGAGILGVDSLGRPITNDRYFIDWNNKMRVGERFRLNSVLNYWSDEFVTRDFRESLFDEDQVPDNFAEATYYGDFYTFSAFTRFLPNSWEQTVQRLPEIRFDMAPLPVLNTGVYQNAYAAYGYYRNASNDMLYDTFSTDRLDAYYGLTRPIKLNYWSSFTPVIGGRLTYYGSTLDNQGSYVRMLGQIGFDAQAEIWGLWQVRSKTLGIDGVRHNLRPIIQYRYIPAASQGSGKIQPIDELYYGTYPSVLDLGLMRNTDNLYTTNVMRFGFENVFQTRDEKYGSREIARLDIYQDVNFDPYPYVTDKYRRTSYSDLYTNISVSPARWLTIGAYNRFDINDGTWAEIDGYVRISDSDEWAVYLGNVYLDSAISQYYAMVQYRISEKYMVLARWNYDSRISKMTDQTYVLRMRMGYSWYVDYMISFRSGSTRENNLSFGARLNLITF